MTAILNCLVLDTSKQLTLLDEIFMVVIGVGTYSKRSKAKLKQKVEKKYEPVRKKQEVKHFFKM